jgi:hypothetical protein
VRLVRLDKTQKLSALLAFETEDDNGDEAEQDKQKVIIDQDKQETVTEAAEQEKQATVVEEK